MTSRFPSTIRPIAVCAALGLASLPAAATPLDTGSSDVRDFVASMSASHDFDATWVENLLAGARIKQPILDAISRPAEKAKPWHEYRTIFVNDKRIAGGVAFWLEHRDALEAASAECGVPVSMIVAILGVETNYGRLTGRYRVLDSLSTLAFHYPPRSAFFRSELEHFLLLSRERGIDPAAATGSYAGAMGAPQFISSSYRRYSMDGDGDGEVDLWASWPDVFASIGNYFRAHGWRPGGQVVARARIAERSSAPVAASTRLSESVKSLRDAGVRFDTGQPDDAAAVLFELDGGKSTEYWVGFDNFYAITRYNRSRMYALAAHQLGDAIAAAVAEKSGR